MGMKKFNRAALLGAALAGILSSALLIGAYFLLAIHISMSRPTWLGKPGAMSWWDVLFGLLSAAAGILVAWSFYKAGARLQKRLERP
jgi:threonine/homoserine/homoserine lactone efflux protein